jgi:hypothetical protein
MSNAVLCELVDGYQQDACESGMFDRLLMSPAHNSKVYTHNVYYGVSMITSMLKPCFWLHAYLPQLLRKAKTLSGRMFTFHITEDIPHVT